MTSMQPDQVARRRPALLALLVALTVAAALWWRPSRWMPPSGREGAAARGHQHPGVGGDVDDERGGRGEPEAGFTGAGFGAGVQARKPAVRKALERLMATWREMNYAQRLRLRGWDVLTAPVGSSSGLPEDSREGIDTPIRRAIREFNDAVWQDGSSLVALADILSSVEDPETLAVASGYLGPSATSYRSQRDPAWYLDSRTCDELVARLEAAGSPYVEHVLTMPLGAMWEKRAIAASGVAAADDSPMSEQTAARLLRWFGENRSSLALPSRRLQFQNVEDALVSSGQTTLEFLRYYEEGARDETRDPSQRSPYVMALALSLEAGDGAGPLVLEFLRSPDAELRGSAMNVLACPRVTSANSAISIEVLDELLRAAQVSTDPTERKQVDGYIALFDDARALERTRTVQSAMSETEFAATVSGYSALLREPRFHAYPKFGFRLASMYLEWGLDGSQTAMRRAASFSAAYEFARRFAIEGRPEAREVFRRIVEEMKGHPDLLIRSEHARIVEDAASVGLAP